MSHMNDSKGVKDLYPTENNALISIQAAVTRELLFRNLGSEDAFKRKFTEQMVNRCAEIGLAVKVTGWEADCSDDPNDWNLYWKPTVEIYDRIDQITELDHDRFQAEVVAGEADGQAGYTREDGTKREDPIKKLIL
jgi:hypothetical protein